VVAGSNPAAPTNLKTQRTKAFSAAGASSSGSSREPRNVNDVKNDRAELIAEAKGDPHSSTPLK
jgi:hypothetical protein